MANQQKTSGSARMAVVYITLGALIDVWSAIWYVYLTRHDPGRETPFFWCYGFLASGLVLLIIGLALGRIGRSARHADLPPDSPPPQPAPPRPVVAAPVYPAPPAVPVMPPGTPVAGPYVVPPGTAAPR
jgi:hypothetical protein